MSGYAVGLMEFSNDDLSDTTPTYVDRSSYVLGDVSWSDGRARDLDEPQAGSITFRLRNANGEWEPNSASSLYPNSPFLLRRFRWSVNGTAEGVWYVTNWQITYPAGTDYSEVQVTAVDGFELLSLDALDLLDPPTATTYEEVVMHDQPFAYYKLGELGGTAVVPVTGPDGVYKGSPVLGGPSLLAGDAGTSAEIATGDYGRFPVDDNQFVDADALTLECWVRGSSVSGAGANLMLGPGGTPIFELGWSDPLGSFEFTLLPTSGAVMISALYGGVFDDTYHVVGTWNGTNMKLYVNGVLGATGTATARLTTPVSTLFGFLGGIGSGGSFTGDYFLSNVAFYEHALSAERVLAHYQAGAERGFDAQTAGARITAVATSDLWAETGIQAGSHTVKAVMETGQSKLDEIRAAMKAEMPDTHFFFDGSGNPDYLGWDYKGTAPYNQSQATFGAGAGEIAYQNIEIVYDDEILNEVTVGHEAAAGEETQHTATDTASVSEFRRRAHNETGLILTDHADAQAVAAAILEAFHEPKIRVASLMINGTQTAARTQILTRQIGDLIRVKGVTGSPDVLTTILGKSKTLTVDGHLTCTWTLARGLDASQDVWYLGIDGYSELGETTVLG